MVAVLLLRGAGGTTGFALQAFCWAAASATIAKVIQNRRFSALRLGASIPTDLAVTQNYRTVDCFLAAPGSANTSVQLNEIGRGRVRLVLRQNAGEENNWILQNWERLEFAIGGALFLLLLFGDRPQKSMLAVSLLLLAIVAAEHFLFTPRILGLGRIIDDLPPTDPGHKTFRLVYGVYGTLDVLKTLTGCGLAARLLIRRKYDRDRFAREYAASAPGRPELQARNNG